MSHEITLTTEGYVVTFQLEPRKDLRSSLDGTVVFTLVPGLSKMEVQSQSMPISVDDLERLAEYLQQHIVNLQADSDSEGETFVPLDLQFQMRASVGEVRSPDDGEFTLQFLVNVGQPDEESSSVYVGGEAVVTLEQIKHFLLSLRHLLTVVAAGA